MSNLNALVVGVSNYYIPDVVDLPFCMNDVTLMEEALIKGLKVQKQNITTCGKYGDAKTEDFKRALSKVTTIDKNDTLIFYFSGHGATIDGQHYLVFSDGIISTQEIIEHFKEIQAKSKVILLDCCFSGNFSIDETSSFNIEKTVEEFQGEGYAVLSSSNSDQVSYGHPEKPVSVFTSFLCDAFQDKHIVKQGKVSLYDIQRLVSLYLEVWNKRNPDKMQHPVFKANMGGTIFFDVKEYQPYYSTNIYAEYDNYIIYKVEPVHTGLAKRYSFKVILKEPLSLEEIGKISLKIKDQAKNIEVYNNEIAEKRWINKLPNIIWVYFGRDEIDIIKNNYICHTTWVDEKQDKKWWYKVNGKETFILNGVHYNIHPYYEQLRSLNIENTVSKEHLVFKSKDILSRMITLAEKVIKIYNDYKNGEITEEELFEEMDAYIPELDKYFIMSTDLDIAPIELHDWDLACSGLFGTIHDFTLFYNKKYKSLRTSENRRACMEMTIKQYYSDLNKISKLEDQILNV